ncbi:MAG: metal-sensitive transcriptional regulator [Patescibacteria group bacterium]|jgi:DNA-binding FrmR family transcriptional regulator|nr:metal-sensitive transcriptional regulator [bacterium]HQC49663.1 metal-sensitive transcriptional regulator [bacterium]
MKTNEQRINIIIGQLEAIKKMLTKKDEDCTKLFIQLKATKSALASLMKKIISEELKKCFTGGKHKKQEKIQKIIKELINN